MKKYSVKIQFIEPLLGTIPKDKEVYKTYIQDKFGVDKEDELKTVEEEEEKGWTGFHTKDGKPVLYNYVIKGFFKDACSMMRRASESKSSKLKAHKKVIDGLVFVSPRQIPVETNGQEIGVLERPLRAQTPQGERVALARSDYCPTGSEVEFELEILGAVSEDLLKEWLDYGELRGLGQWRNASYGSFTYALTKR